MVLNSVYPHKCVKNDLRLQGSEQNTREMYVRVSPPKIPKPDLLPAFPSPLDLPMTKE